MLPHPYTCIYCAHTNCPQNKQLSHFCEIFHIVARKGRIHCAIMETCLKMDAFFLGMASQIMAGVAQHPNIKPLPLHPLSAVLSFIAPLHFAVQP
jgi:hypothetical protein